MIVCSYTPTYHWSALFTVGEVHSRHQRQGEIMTAMIERRQFADLGYYLGVKGIAKLSCAGSDAEARDWVRGEKKPSTEQSARLQCVHRHLKHKIASEGPNVNLEWFFSEDVITHLHKNNFAEVDKLAGFHTLINID